MKKYIILNLVCIILLSQNLNSKDKVMLYTYKIQENLKPSGLKDISDNQINDHWQLYVGYVNQVNKIDNNKQRLGFEYNGMVLHEYYFENLKAGEQELEKESPLYKALEKNFGSYQNWLEDFVSTGKTRGIGWVILYLDPKTGVILNAFIKDHENGHISGFIPILVMDVWEHAYMVDHNALGRADYINAFIKNINWKIVENRFSKYYK